jgi:hypothetical protein
LDILPSDLPSGINQSFWYDTLLFDSERSGILLLEATIDETKNSITIVMGNTTYDVWMDAVDVMVGLADLHLPMTVNRFNIVIEEEGHRVNSIQLRRPSLDYNKSRQLVEREISIDPVRPLKFVQHRTDFVQKKIVFDVNLDNRVQLFDPDDPARYQLYAKVGIGMALPRSWDLIGAYGVDITNNFDESTRDSDSVIQKVRSDVVKYLTEGDTGLDSLYVQKRGNLLKDTYFRVFGGVLESMYSGVGGEVLYQPFQSRLAFGLSANWVSKRTLTRHSSTWTTRQRPPLPAPTGRHRSITLMSRSMQEGILQGTWVLRWRSEGPLTTAGWWVFGRPGPMSRPRTLERVALTRVCSLKSRSMDSWVAAQGVATPLASGRYSVMVVSTLRTSLAVFGGKLGERVLMH